MKLKNIDSCLIFVVYDGIDHSIFESQVIQPLLKRFKNSDFSKIYIISFEKKITKKIESIKLSYENLYTIFTFIFFKKNIFFCTYFLKNNIKDLKNFLKPLKSTYHLIARGPFAGWISKKGITSKCLSITIQARGLLAEEFSYTHKNDFFLKKPFLFLRKWQFFYFEKKAYQHQHTHVPFLIESVSKALTFFLQTTYNLPKDIFIPAFFDKPDTITKKEKEKYNNEIRSQLSLNKDAIIYIFNGSLKPWQCPKESILYFKHEWLKNKNCYFLALTFETTEMEKLILSYNLDKNSFKVLSVLAHKVIPYLCTAQYGFLLREQHIINFVSRPTKLLEYQAAGIKIIHNNTIDLLIT